MNRNTYEPVVSELLDKFQEIHNSTTVTFMGEDSKDSGHLNVTL